MPGWLHNMSACLTYFIWGPILLCHYCHVTKNNNICNMQKLWFWF